MYASDNIELHVYIHGPFMVMFYSAAKLDDLKKEFWLKPLTEIYQMCVLSNMYMIIIIYIIDGSTMGCQKDTT